MGTSSSTLHLGRSVSVLLAQPVPLDAHDVWKEIFTTKVSPTEVWMCLPPEILRRMRAEQPGNLAAIVFKCIEQLHIFHTTAEAARDPISATNAVLIIGRVMPFVFEAKVVNAEGHVVEEPRGPHGISTFAQRMLWDNDVCDGTDKKWPVTAPLGKMLMQTLCASAFVPGFTLLPGQTLSADTLPGFPSVEYHLLWCGGIGASPNVPLSWSESVLHNRVLVVKAILAALSEECFQARAAKRPQLRAVLVDERACPHAGTLVASLLNTVATYTTKGVLPYTSHWVGAREELVLRSTQLLSVLFDIDDVEPQDQATAQRTPDRRSESPHESDAPAPEKSDKPEPTTTAPPAAPAGPDHAAWSLLERCDAKAFDLIIGGLSKLLNNHYDSKNVNLPGSQRALSFLEEFVILFFKLTTRSGAFLRHLVNHPEVTKFLVPLLDFCMDAREDAALISNLQLVIYLLMKLTAVREFCLACNALYYGWLPFQLSCYFSGNHNDLLIISMHALITCKSPWVLPIHEPAATIIANLSSFMTKVSMASAAKLMQLLDHYSKPQVLEQGRAACSILASVVEAIANLIQYQYAGTGTVIYQLIYCEKLARDLHKGLVEGTLPIPPEIKKRMHAFTLVCCLDALIPQIQIRIQRDVNADIYQFIQTTSLVGALPVPHSIVVRQYVNRPQTETWLAAWLWGCIFLHSQPVFLDARTVDLFEMRSVA